MARHDREMRWLLALFLLGALDSCATNIKPPPDAAQPAKAKLGSYAVVMLKPLTTEANVQPNVSERIEAVLRECLAKVFPTMKPFESSPDKALIIEPRIVDIKKVSIAERFFWGPLAGSSAGLLGVHFVDSETKEIIADPIFYGRANAWGGAVTIGATDNHMLSRLPEEACDYSRANY